VFFLDILLKSGVIDQLILSDWPDRSCWAPL